MFQWLNAKPSLNRGRIHPVRPVFTIWIGKFPRSIYNFIIWMKMICCRQPLGVLQFHCSASQNIISHYQYQVLTSESTVGFNHWFSKCGTWPPCSGIFEILNEIKSFKTMKIQQKSWISSACFIVSLMHVEFSIYDELQAKMGTKVSK